MFGWTIGAWLVVVIIPLILTAIPVVQYINERKEWRKEDQKNENDYEHHSVS